MRKLVALDSETLDLLRNRVSLSDEIEQAEEEWLDRSHQLEELSGGQTP